MKPTNIMEAIEMALEERRIDERVERARKEVRKFVQGRKAWIDALVELERAEAVWAFDSHDDPLIEDELLAVLMDIEQYYTTDASR